MALMLPLVVILGGATAIMLYESLWSGVIFMLLTDILVLYAITSFRYVIDQNTLFIHGFIFRKRIEIEDIERIYPTRTPLAAPAASLDRLEIIGRHGSVVVSPAEKTDFIHQLQNINPDIKFADAL